MTLVRWTPFGEMGDLRHDLEETMDRFFGRRTGDNDVSTRTWSPSVDIRETGDSMVFSVEVPGFEKEDLNISVDDGVLTISGERTIEESETKNYLRIERFYGKVYRSFRLPGTVDSENISANLKNGVLTVTLPKREEAKPRQIPVTV